MPKLVTELLHPDLPPPRQPHTAIVALLLASPSNACTFEEILEAVRSSVPTWRVTDELPVTQRVALGAAVDDLLMTGLVRELSDGVERYFALLPAMTIGSRRE